MKKKMLAVLLTSVFTACIPISGMAAEVNTNNEKVDTFSVSESEAAIPLNGTQSRAAVITWGYGLTGSIGWISGHDITATSSAKRSGVLVTIDSMKTTLAINSKNDGSLSKDKQGKSSSQSVNLFWDFPKTKISSYVSTHTFKHKGYVTTNKTIKKTPSTI